MQKSCLPLFHSRMEWEMCFKICSFVTLFEALSEFLTSMKRKPSSLMSIIFLCRADVQY